MIHETHSNLMSGHLGFEKTLERAKSRFYWPYLAKSIKEFTRECLPCQMNKSWRKTYAPMAFNQPLRPLELVTADITEVTPSRTTHIKYILVICDHFTKFVQAYPIRSQSARDIASKFIDYMMIFGIPEQILTDQGLGFQAELVSEIYDLLDIRRLRTTPYWPQCDGITEKFNSTMKDMLKAFINENQDNWEDLLNKITFAYNTATHKTTQYTPFELMFGRQPRIPID